MEKRKSLAPMVIEPGTIRPYGVGTPTRLCLPGVLVRTLLKVKQPDVEGKADLFLWLNDSLCHGLMLVLCKR